MIKKKKEKLKMTKINREKLQTEILSIAKFPFSPN